MNNSVVIKAHPHGIIVVLDNKKPFEELKELIAEKFRDSAKFLGNAQTAISFERRKLSDDEQREVLDIIASESKLHIVCILEHDEEKDSKLERALNEKLMELGSSTGQFVRGNLRSGQVLEMETSIIVIGDVNPGASITSKGNIIVIGALKGTAFAGAGGDEDAFVFALDMSPVQIRIADTIARAPDGPFKNEPKEAKIAFLEDGNIYIELINKKVLSDINVKNKMGFNVKNKWRN